MTPPFIFNGKEWGFSDVSLSVKDYFGKEMTFSNITEVNLKQDPNEEIWLCEIVMPLTFAKQFESSLGQGSDAGKVSRLPNTSFALNITLAPSEKAPAMITARVSGQGFFQILDSQKGAQLYRIYKSYIFIDKEYLPLIKGSD